MTSTVIDTHIYAGWEEAEKFMSKSPCILTITSKNPIKAKLARQLSSFKSICSSQKEDPHFDRIHQLLINPHRQQIPYLEHYSVLEGELFYRRHKSTDQWLVCIPRNRID